MRVFATALSQAVIPVEWAFEIARSGPSSERMLGGSGGTSTTAIINIHAKFQKTSFLKDGSPCLPLNRKYLQGRRVLQNR